MKTLWWPQSCSGSSLDYTLSTARVSHMYAKNNDDLHNLFLFDIANAALFLYDNWYYICTLYVPVSGD